MAQEARQTSAAGALDPTPISSSCSQFHGERKEGTEGGVDPLPWRGVVGQAAGHRTAGNGGAVASPGLVVPGAQAEASRALERHGASDGRADGVTDDPGVPGRERAAVPGEGRLDSIYGEPFKRAVAVPGMEEVLTASRCPCYSARTGEASCGEP